MSVEEEWWNTEYAMDIVQTFQDREKRLPEYKCQSPQLHLRRGLVDWLVLVAESFSLCDTAFHIAVYLLDRFMDNHDIEETRLRLVALGCLSVASKFEEKDGKVPRLTAFRTLCSNMFTLNEFVQVELLVLKHFDWELCVPTAAHFVDYFCKAAVSSTDKIMGQSIASVNLIAGHLRNYNKYFLDLSLQHHEFIKFLPSMVAASCLASSRKCLVLSPDWPIAIQKMTKYTSEDMIPCMELLLQMYEQDKYATRSSAKRSCENDSGLEDSSSSTSDRSDTTE